MPDDAREPLPFGSIERMAIELSIVEWQTVTQVLSLAPYVRVFKVLGEIERQARALDQQRAQAQAEQAQAEVRERQRQTDYWRQEANKASERTAAAHERADRAEKELRAMKRAKKAEKNENGGTADAAGADIPQGESD